MSSESVEVELGNDSGNRIRATLSHSYDYKSPARITVCSDAGTFTAATGMYIHSICTVREQLEARGLRLLCNADRADVWPSAMLSEHLEAYSHHPLGIQDQRVDILDPIPFSLAATVTEQENYLTKWRSDAQRRYDIIRLNDPAPEAARANPWEVLNGRYDRAIMSLRDACVRRETNEVTTGLDTLRLALMNETDQIERRLAVESTFLLTPGFLSAGHFDVLIKILVEFESFAARSGTQPGDTWDCGWPLYRAVAYELPVPLVRSMMSAIVRAVMRGDLSEFHASRVRTGARELGDPARVSECEAACTELPE